MTWRYSFMSMRPYLCEKESRAPQPAPAAPIPNEFPREYIPAPAREMEGGQIMDIRPGGFKWALGGRE